MKHIIKYKKFCEAYISSDNLEKYFNLIKSYIERKTGFKYFEYYEPWIIEKSNGNYLGKLFISAETTKAFRINWIEDESEVNTIDLWDSFNFNANPDYTLLLENYSVVNVLPQILEFFNDPTKFLESNESTRTELENQLVNAEKKLKRLRNADSIDKQNKIINNLKATLAGNESHTTENIEIIETAQDNGPSIDVFKSIELYTVQVAKGISNALLVTGLGGVGKTQTITDTLESLGMKDEVDYEKVSGTATAAALYEILFINRNNLVLFDDCDSVFKDPEAVNILKAVLDTKKERKVARLAKSTNYFSSRGMTDIEIEDTYLDTQKLPNKFTFSGQIIFISNLEEKKIDDALLTRAIHVDVNLTDDEILDRMLEILPKIFKELSMDIKMEALNYLKEVVAKYDTKFPLNFRTLIHSINIRMSNTGKTTVRGESIDTWKLLIKKYLIRG